MSDRELAQLFGRATRDLDAMQRQRIRQLQGIERELFDGLVAKLMDALDTGGGRITTRRGSASINRLVDEVFRAMERGGLKTFYQTSLQDLFRILGNNDIYNAALFATISRAGDKRYKEIRSQVDRVMRAKIGIDERGKSISGGYFDNLLQGVSRGVRTEIQQVINAGVGAGIPTGKLMRQIEITVKGTRANPGTLSRALQPHIFDTYQQFDRSSNNVYAKKLGLDAFVYQGGLIETSRDFCIKKNGKVFTKKEAEMDWPKDPTLPRKTVERNSGTLQGYNPTVDLGRWNCRHRTRFISRAIAEELRPDLKRT